MYLVRSGSTSGFHKLVTSLGQNPITMIADVGLSPSQFRNENTYISYSKLAELLELAALRCKCPNFGLMLASQQNTHVLGELALIASQEETVGDALDSISKALYLHARGVHLKKEQSSERTRLSLEFELSSPLGLEQLIQMSVGHLASFTAELLNVDRRTIPMSFYQQGNERHSGGENVFSNVSFGESFDGITLNNKVLGVNNYKNQEAIKRHFDHYLQSLKQQYPNNLEDQVVDIIGNLLPSGECCLNKVADTLDMHPRVLQERLQKINLNYSVLLKRTRQDFSERHLREKTMTVTDLALSLGFSDVSVFSRNFKSWTGLSPKQWQKCHQR